MVLGADSRSRVMRTAHFECVWMQQPAFRLVNAAMNRGVHWEGLRLGGERR